MAYSCEICQKCFTRRSSFAKHCQSHRKVKNYSCTVCPGSSFQFISSLLDHKQNVHGDQITPRCYPIFTRGQQVKSNGEIDQFIPKSVNDNRQQPTLENYNSPADAKDSNILLSRQIKIEKNDRGIIVQNQVQPLSLDAVKLESIPLTSSLPSCEKVFLRNDVKPQLLGDNLLPILAENADSFLRNDLKPELVGDNPLPVPAENADSFLSYDVKPQLVGDNLPIPAENATLNSQEKSTSMSILEKLLTKPMESTDQTSLFSSPRNVQEPSSNVQTSLLKNLLLGSNNRAMNKLEAALRGCSDPRAIDNMKNILLENQKNINENGSESLIKIVNVISLAGSSELYGNFSLVEPKVKSENLVFTSPGNFIICPPVETRQSDNLMSMPNSGNNFLPTELPVHETFSMRAYLEKHAQDQRKENIIPTFSAESTLGTSPTTSVSPSRFNPSHIEIPLTRLSCNQNKHCSCICHKASFNAQSYFVTHNTDCLSEMNHVSDHSVTSPIISQNHVSTPSILHRILSIPKGNEAGKSIRNFDITETSVSGMSETETQNDLSVPRINCQKQPRKEIIFQDANMEHLPRTLSNLQHPIWYPPQTVYRNGMMLRRELTKDIIPQYHPITEIQ